MIARRRRWRLRHGAGGGSGRGRHAGDPLGPRQRGDAGNGFRPHEPPPARRGAAARPRLHRRPRRTGERDGGAAGGPGTGNREVPERPRRLPATRPAGALRKGDRRGQPAVADGNRGVDGSRPPAGSADRPGLRRRDRPRPAHRPDAGLRRPRARARAAGAASHPADAPLPDRRRHGGRAWRRTEERDRHRLRRLGRRAARGLGAGGADDAGLCRDDAAGGRHGRTGGDACRPLGARGSLAHLQFGAVAQFCAGPRARGGRGPAGRHGGGGCDRPRRLPAWRAPPGRAADRGSGRRRARKAG